MIIEYCVINTCFGKFFFGTWEEVLGEISIIDLKKNLVTVMYYKSFTIPSYSKEWTKEEITTDIYRLIYTKLKDNDFPDWKIFKTID